MALSGCIIGNWVQHEVTAELMTACTMTAEFSTSFMIPKKEEFKMKQKRFVVHGFGCKNWSEIVESEKELKKLIKKVSEDKNWTGEIVAFELKPKYYVKRSTSIKKA